MKQECKQALLNNYSSFFRTFGGKFISHPPMFPRNIKKKYKQKTNHPNPKNQQSTSSTIHQVSMVFWGPFQPLFFEKKAGSFRTTEVVVTCSLDYLIRTWDAKSFEMLQDWAFRVRRFPNRHEFVSRNPWLVNTRNASSICYPGFGCCAHAYPHLFVQKISPSL